MKKCFSVLAFCLFSSNAFAGVFLVTDEADLSSVLLNSWAVDVTIHGSNIDILKEDKTVDYQIPLEVLKNKGLETLAFVKEMVSGKNTTVWCLVANSKAKVCYDVAVQVRMPARKKIEEKDSK